MAVFWNDTLNAEFKEMRLVRKVPVAEMAIHFGTTVAAIYAHARVINALVMERHVFSDDDIMRLQAMALAGDSDKEMSRTLRRSIGSIRWKIDDLDLLDVRKAARQARIVPTPVRVTAPAAPTIPRIRAPRRPPGRPRGARPVKPLSEEEIAVLKSSIGRRSLRAIAADMHVSVQTMKARAAASGVAVDISLRRHGHDLTREVLEPLIALGLTPCQAGKRLNRDRRTVLAAADTLGLRFPSRKDKVADARIVRAEKKALTVVARAVHLAHTREVTKRARASKPTAPKHVPCSAAKPVTAKMVALATHGKGLPVRKAVVARPARELKVRVLEAPAPARPAPIPKPPHRPFGFTFSSGGKPKEILSQCEVDAAVARFIRERGITRAQETPEEAAVKAARRLGYAVLRDGTGFILDGRIKLESVTDLEAFVRKREGARLQMTA